MTEKGVKSIYVPYFGMAKITSSMDTARQEIIKGTMIVDQAGDAEALMSEAHCDDEQLEACSQKLIKLRQEIPKLLTKGQVGLARAKLGRALHTLQD
ncbi:hypothetical protein LTR84_008738 [Exophiala bonariae]|uniref:VWA7 N-terminal domain-containing protein n=1 Tax=Exophiala bonariae TaxID=1690606 RepID=A0AAV9MZH3_9EURO|nr:hypothetical protein LTR84_008738 [Exophiala bonariae]